METVPDPTTERNETTTSQLPTNDPDIASVREGLGARTLAQVDGQSRVDISAVLRHWRESTPAEELGGHDSGGLKFISLSPSMQAAYFEDKCLRATPGCQAETWRDAQLWAADIIDTQHKFSAAMAQRFGPRWWEEYGVGHVAVDVRRLACVAVEACRDRAIQHCPPLDMVPGVLRSYIPFEQVYNWAALWGGLALAPANEKLLARFMCWLSCVCEAACAIAMGGYVRSEKFGEEWARRRGKTPRQKKRDTPRVGLHSLAMDASDLAQLAEHLAAIGDTTAARVAGIARFLERELRREDTEPFAGVKLLPEMSPDSDVSRGENYSLLAYEVAAMCEIDHEEVHAERSGVAFLSAALRLSWGSERKHADTFVDALMKCWKRARHTDRVLHEREQANTPESQYGKSVRNALYELGYDASKYRNSWSKG